MPTKKKAAAPEPTPIHGYRRPPVYAWREYTPQLGEGEEMVGEPLKVKVQVNLSLADKDAIPTGDDATFADVYAAIAPYVVDWNIERRDLESGEFVKAPSPAEAGPEVLELLDEVEGIWLLTVVRLGRSYGRTDVDEKKGETPSTPTATP